MPPDWIFVEADPQGRTVGLARKKFEDKICVLHPGFPPEAIAETIRNPDVITENEGHDSTNYWQFVPSRRFYRMVAAKPRAEGHAPGYSVPTAYLPTSPPTGRIIWQKQTAP